MLIAVSNASGLDWEAVLVVPRLNGGHQLRGMVGGMVGGM